MEECIVKVNRVSKGFNENAVLDNCSINVKRGEVYGLLGENGAGKTTLFKMILGLLKTENGEILVFNKDISNLENRKYILKNIGTLIETPCFYDHLSARKNLEIHCEYMNADTLEIDEVLAKVGLSNKGDMKVKNFSLGMKQRLGIARAIIHKPKLLILDEPINGLDPIGIKQMRELFRKIAAEENTTILISSHILGELEKTVDTISLLNNGTIKEELKIAAINKDQNISLEDYFIKNVR